LGCCCYSAGLSPSSTTCGSGIRHLAWDAGYGFEIPDAYRSGYAVIAATLVLTVLAWLYVILA